MDNIEVEVNEAVGASLPPLTEVYAVKTSFPDYRNGGTNSGISLYRTLEGALKWKKEFIDMWEDGDDSDEEDDSDHDDDDDSDDDQEEEEDDDDDDDDDEESKDEKEEEDDDKNVSVGKKRKNIKKKGKKKVKKSKSGNNEMWFSKTLSDGDYIECEIEEIQFNLNNDLICEL